MIKSHYLSHQARDLDKKRAEAETRASSGIMSLGLLSDEEAPPPSPPNGNGDSKNGNEGSKKGGDAKESENGSKSKDGDSSQSKS